LVIGALLISVISSTGAGWAAYAGPLPDAPIASVHPAEEIVDVRRFADYLRSVLLPQWHLTDSVAKDAIDKIGTAGFYCALVGEQENILDRTKPYSPFVSCTRLFFNTGRVYGFADVGMFMEGWRGNGTSLGVRHDQLATDEVTHVSSGRAVFEDSSGMPITEEAFRTLDETLARAGINPPVADFTKIAMTHAISCRSSPDQGNLLECMTFNPTPHCSVAIYRVAVTEDKNAGATFSLWTHDRQVTSATGSWSCARPRIPKAGSGPAIRHF
jgi:hypothetical protein